MSIDDVFVEVAEMLGRSGAGPSIEILALLEPLAVGSTDKAVLLDKVEDFIQKHFRSINGLPDWMQEAAWPIFDQRPMVFIGQINIPKSAGLFHDDGMAYLFLDQETGVKETVIQLS